MHLTFRQKKLFFLVAILISRFSVLSQVPPYCTYPSYLKTTTLTDISLPSSGGTLLPNFRFLYTVTTECGTNAFDYGSEVLTLVNPTNQSNPIKSYGLIKDSDINVTGVIDPCLNLLSPPCYHKYYYHADVYVNLMTVNLTASVTNCCRPRNIANLLITPDYVDYQNPPPPPAECPSSCGPIGNAIVSWLRIPHVALVSANSSPQFNSLDTIINVCKNNPFSYQVGASDPDGDSMAYHFSAPCSITLLPHVPSCDHQSFTLFPKLYFRDGFSEQQPVGSSVSLDPFTGLISGSMPDTGVYLITVNIPEYRNGVTLDSVTQDYYIHVYDCSLLPRPKASIPDSINNCNDFTIQFPNNSTPIYADVNWNNTAFLWNFGDGDSSGQVYPQHTYSDSGTFNLRLIIFPGLYCADTAYSKVLVYPSLHSDFTHVDSCSDQPAEFLNESTATGLAGKIDYSKWLVLKKNTAIDSSNMFNANFIFHMAPETYLVILTVGTEKGCISSDSQYVNIRKSPYPLDSHDTILARGASLQLSANDGNYNYYGQFNWWPPEGLSDPTIADPVLNTTMDNTYYVSMQNSFGCKLQDSIRVKYYTGPEIYVPNAFTPNGDGKNDIFRPIPVGISTMQYFKVFSRYGQLVFQTSKPFNGWDGNIGGKPAPEGTYVWEAAGVDYQGRTIAKKGTVILTR
ncbi:MAG TPA: T9SS type B sorting domain-containing protein [Puia sp.]|nr:T9SS type B sorting domain-containing protein [Puia sp.]